MKHVLLISGESGTGKSRSLKNLPNHERVVYLCCEADKELPFKNSFKKYNITDPEEVPAAIEAFNGDPDIDIIFIDTLTFLMDMYESEVVLQSSDSRKAWGDYAQFFKRLMQQHVAKSDKTIIFLAHTDKEVSPSGDWHTAVPVKGALKKNGIEAYFDIVVSTKKIALKDLKDYENPMLNITEREKLVNYKHVFQTQVTKNTIHERIRSPEDLFDLTQTFIDNDVAVLLNHLDNYRTQS